MRWVAVLLVACSSSSPPPAHAVPVPPPVVQPPPDAARPIDAARHPDAPPDAPKCPLQPNPPKCPAEQPNVNHPCTPKGIECIYEPGCCPPIYVCNKTGHFEAHFQSCD
jgi:hypothetical protein